MMIQDPSSLRDGPISDDLNASSSHAVKIGPAGSVDVIRRKIAGLILVKGLGYWTSSSGIVDNEAPVVVLIDGREIFRLDAPSNCLLGVHLIIGPGELVIRAINNSPGSLIFSVAMEAWERTPVKS